MWLTLCTHSGDVLSVPINSYCESRQNKLVKYKICNVRVQPYGAGILQKDSSPNKF